MAELTKELKGKLVLLTRCEKERKEPEERWKNALEHVLPLRTQFMGKYFEDKRFDTTATRNVHKLADGMFGSNCPQAINWFKYRFVDDALNDDKEAITWLQDAERVSYDAINRSNFYDTLPILIRNGIAFETTAFAVSEDLASKRIVCNTLPVDEIYFQVTAQNEVYRIFRKFTLSAEQGEIEYGKNALHSQVKNALDLNTDYSFEVVHIVERRYDIDEEKLDSKNMPWRSITIDRTNSFLIKDGGIKIQQPFIWRFEVRGNSPYGYGPTSDAFPDIYTANAMVSDIMGASQKALDPPLFQPEETDWTLEAGANNYYKDPGRQAYTIRPYIDMPINLELLNDVREAIKASYKAEYFMPLMQLADKNMTAREVFERKSERVTATGSIQGRFTGEVITPFLARVFQIETDAGRIPPMPEGLEGKQIKVDFLSPLAQEQKEVANAQGILASLDTVMPIFQLWPQTTDKIIPEELVDKIFDSTGMPEKAIRSDKDYNDIQEAKSQNAAQDAELQRGLVQAEIAAKAGQTINNGGVQ